MSAECFSVRNLGDPIFLIFFPAGDPGCCLQSFQVVRQRHCRNPAYLGGLYLSDAGYVYPPPPAVFLFAMLSLSNAPEEPCICLSLLVYMLGLWLLVSFLYVGLPLGRSLSIATGVLSAPGWSQCNYPETGHGAWPSTISSSK